jgi:EF-P beta-lysylation protein EpmB
MAEQVLWRHIQRQSFTSISELVDFLELSNELRARVLMKTAFPLLVPIRLAKKMAKNTLDDPLIRQFLPLVDEEKKDPRFVKEPVQDSSFRKENRLLQKYPERALLVTTSACAMNCRFCFRRHFDYSIGETSFDAEIQALEEDPTLSEVILSGGDPLSLSDEKLQNLFNRLDQVPHLKRIRFHTRFPIGIPERIDASFLSLLKSSTKQVVFIIHCNHSKELDEDVLDALKSIQKLGIPVLNQAVLLKGVNDDPTTLKKLMETLVDRGIFPYYLHQLDKVEGATHFEVDQKTGTELIEKLASCLSGYAVPKYVSEIPGETQKTLL